jgi:hypothetical protein
MGSETEGAGGGVDRFSKSACTAMLRAGGESAGCTVSDAQVESDTS